MGRRKIEMKKVEDKGSRQVTFSKRRSGLFKKAYELATLCAVQIAIVVFSPGGKPYSYGHPNIEILVSRFTNRCHKKLPSPGFDEGESSEGASYDELNRKLNDLNEKLLAEIKNEEILKRFLTKKGKEIKSNPIDDLSPDELETLKGKLRELRYYLKESQNEIEASSSLLLLSQNATT